MNTPEDAVNLTSTVNQQNVIWIGHIGDLPIAFNNPYYQIIQAEDWKQAARSLNICFHRNDFQLKVIIGTYPNDKNSMEMLKKFLRFKSTYSDYRTIPMLLVTDSSIPLTQISVIPGIDDHIHSFISEEELNRKIKFLKKYKHLKGISQNVTYKPSILEKMFIGKFDRLLKRSLDILISAVALLLLSPLFLIIALIVKLESKGSPFYFAYRAGSNYKVFRFYKFRTMVNDADKKLSQLNHLNQYGSSPNSSGPVFFKVTNDPRITRFGRFLRNTSLDELPQLVNVLKGDMSLVGNRPLPLYEARTLTTDQFAERFDAPAGITGLWQISRRGRENMSVEERIRLDIDYARNNSLWHDLAIIIQTPKSLIQKENV